MSTINDPKLLKLLLAIQREEITEALVYERIALFVKDPYNKEIINKIAAKERTHALIWESYTKKKISPNRFKIWFYIICIRFFGLTFGIKLMEKNEQHAALDYHKLANIIPEAERIKIDEEEHERQLIDMVKDKSLNYLGSIVLGLNDALVELTGVLAGLTFGLQNSNMIASVGIITGISAAFSMAGSEYLSAKTDGNSFKKSFTASLYTGLAYVITVVMLILPYLLISNVYTALIITILLAITIIAIFNFYASIAKGYSFKHRFFEMTAISLGVAFISFIIGIIVKQVFGIDV